MEFILVGGADAPNVPDRDPLEKLLALRFIGADVNALSPPGALTGLPV
ncbi:hypothetical protein [Salinibacter sp.]|nr:hypothetical protein [Salinibacter sp.]